MNTFAFLFGFFANVLPIFAQPNPWPVITKENKPWARWWWMGNAVDTTNLSWSLRAYAAAGFGGLEIAPIYGVKGYEDQFIPFLSAEWMNMLAHTVFQAEKLQLGIDLTTGTGWPFGGPQVEIPDAATKSEIRKFAVAEGRNFAQKIRPADPEQQEAALLSLTAYDQHGKATLLTDRVSADGTLAWQPPKGGAELWAVFAGKTFQQVKRAAPGGEGLTLDHLSKEALEHYLARFDAAFQREAPGIRAFYNDSYEVYGADWSPTLFQKFKRSRRYDLRLHVRELFSEDTTGRAARIKSDYRETMAEMLLHNFTESWTDWAHGYGSLTKNQAHGSPANLLDLYAAVDIPEMETFGSSTFQIPGLKPSIKPRQGDKPDPMLMKFPASAAHLTGKRLVSSETFTWLGEHFQSSLAQFKPEVEQCFLAGINHVFYHGITYSPAEAPWPGWLFYASVNMVPNNSWWPHVQGLNAYITRVQSVLQSAEVANEVLLYWPVYDLWDDPSDRMKTFTVHNVEEWLYPSAFYQAAVQMEKNGFGVDFVSDQLLEDLYASKGMLQTPAGKNYRVLVIPTVRRMPYETLEKIQKLAAAGVRVVFERLPEDISGWHDYPSRSAEFRQLIAELTKHAGVVQQTADVVATLKVYNLSRETLGDDGLRFLKFHRDGTVGYYLVNHGPEDIDRSIRFGVTASNALFMDPQTSEYGWTATVVANDHSTVRVQLRAGESLFVQFPVQEVAKKNRPWIYRNGVERDIQLDGEWSLQFVSGGPKLPAPSKLPAPRYWTELEAEEYANFSGIAAYETHCLLDHVDTNRQYELVLNELAESARVYVNGDDAGLVWSVPGRLEIGRFLKAGNNIIRIEVANLMANRMRYLDRNQIKWNNYAGTNVVNIDYKPFNATEWPVLPSGLSGPVFIQVIR